MSTTTPTPRPLLRAVELGLAHALLLVLAFPPVFLPYAALLIPVPALLASRITTKTKRAALVFGLATTPGWASLHLWLIDITAVGAPFAVLVLGLYASAFVLLAHRAARVVPWWIAAPLAWTAVEFFRGRLGFDGYPWYLAAQPLAATPLAAPIPAVGVYGAGLLVALAGALAIDRRWKILALGTAALTATLLVGGSLFSGVKWRGETRVALVQTNVPQDNKITWTIAQRVRDFDEFVALTREAALHAPDLIVWPETMFPGGELDPESLAAMRDANLAFPDGRPATWFADQLIELQAELNIPILVGAIAHDHLRITTNTDGSITYESHARHNSAILIIDAAPRAERYDKLHLTPFGEVMPYISRSDWLESKLLTIGAPGMAFDLSPGAEPTVFEIDGFRFATPICFEATMPGVCRTLAYENRRRRVDALVQLTNDGWFGESTGGRETHLLLARCRAIELGLPVIRAANTGISALIGIDGRVIDAAEPQTAGVTVVSAPRYVSAGTLYGRFLGDSAGWLALAGTFAAAASSFRRKKTPEETHACPATPTP